MDKFEKFGIPLKGDGIKLRLESKSRLNYFSFIMAISPFPNLVIWLKELSLVLTQTI